MKKVKDMKVGEIRIIRRQLITAIPRDSQNGCDHCFLYISPSACITGEVKQKLGRCCGKQGIIFVRPSVEQILKAIEKKTEYVWIHSENAHGKRVYRCSFPQGIRQINLWGNTLYAAVSKAYIELMKGCASK